MNTLTLYGIKREYQELMDAIEEQGGEITPEQEQALAINAENYVEKAENYGRYILYLDQYAKAAKMEIDRITKLNKRAEATQERLKGKLLEAVEVFGTEPLEKLLTVKIGTRKSEVVVVDNPELLPADYIVTKVTTAPDKTAIKAAIKAGQTVAGAYLETRQNLSIR